MVSSGRSAGDCLPGERFVCCRRWQDPAENFEDVVVRGRRGPRVSVEMLSGPETGETVNVFASSLWEPDQLAHAKERRERDLRIAELDRGHPVDHVSRLAMEILCDLATGDTDIYSQATLEAVLSQLGRSTDPSELHELAYVDDGGGVSAPMEAWRELFEELARSVSDVIEERASELASGRSRVGDADRGAAIARIRLWAGLPPIAPALEVNRVPRERDAARRIQQAVSEAAAGLLAPPEHSSSDDASLLEEYRAYLRSREELGKAELSVSKEIDATRQIGRLAERLCAFSAAASESLMTWLLGQVGVRGELCDHVVWSSYSAQHPRTLHLFPDGHLFPDEEGVSRATPGTLTACGRQITLRWNATRPWERAWRGEWLQHFEALARYRQQVEQEKTEGGPRQNHHFEPDYEMARRICPRCTMFHGLFLDCLEPAEEGARWPPWRMAEVTQQVESLLGDRLRQGGEIGSLERARHIALEVWLGAEIELTAREVKRRGPGPLRRLFGERERRSPSLYEQWSASCGPSGLEPHELIGESLWVGVLSESLALFEPEASLGSGRRDIRDRIRSVVEARIAGLR